MTTWRHVCGVKINNMTQNLFAFTKYAFLELWVPFTKYRFEILIYPNRVTPWRHDITQIILLESVQRDFTKRLIGCSNLTYHERLILLKMQSLEHRRLIADLIMAYNIINKNNCLNTDDFFTLNHNQNLRGHQLKISIPLSKLNTRSHFLSNRVVSVWNSLPPSLVLSPTISSFKYRLRKTDLNKYLIFPSTY